MSQGNRLSSWHKLSYHYFNFQDIHAPILDSLNQMYHFKSHCNSESIVYPPYWSTNCTSTNVWRFNAIFRCNICAIILIEDITLLSSKIVYFWNIFGLTETTLFDSWPFIGKECLITLILASKREAGAAIFSDVRHCLGTRNKGFPPVLLEIIKLIKLCNSFHS